MNTTKIEWCDSTWNPVTGCLHGCEYCYARRIAQRFSYDKKTLDAPPELQRVWIEDTKRCGGGYGNHVLRYPVHLLDGGRKVPYPFGFAPTLHSYKLNEPQQKKNPQTIFVCSMADLFGAWVPDEWIEAVFEACEKAQQHRYLFLTKKPERYCEVGVPVADNLWFGVSITKKSEMGLFNYLPAFNHGYVSMEPILEDLEPEKSNLLFAKNTAGVEWVILGAETGNRKDKVVPQREWIDAICEQADKKEVPVFMKDSLIPIMGEKNMRREFPWEGRTSHE